MRPVLVSDLDVPFASNPKQDTFLRDARELADEADTATPVPMLVDDMLMTAGTWLLHGDWRTLKTWIVLELLIAGATGTPAFGLLPVSEAFTSLYVGNEDADRRIGGRVSALCRGRGISLPRGSIGISANKGAWFDDLDWRARITSAVRDRGDRMVMFDPLRSVTAGVDQGPRDFQPFALDCRRLIVDTDGATVGWVHHDGKPLAGQADTRRRGHRASGGGILSAADTPVHAERIGEEPRLVLTPCAWKHASDPSPVEIELQTEERDGKLWIARLIGHRTAANTSANLVLVGKIRSLLAESPGLSGSAIARHVKSGKAIVLETLAAMQQRGDVDSYTSGKNGSATNWMLANKEPKA